MRKNFKLIAWFAGVVLFLLMATLSSRLGIVMALHGLPPSAQVAPSYPLNEEVFVGSDESAVYFSESVQPLRDFYFSNPTQEARQTAEPLPDGILRLFGSAEVRPLEQDADAVRIKVLSGPLTGEEFWVHLSQLPTPRKATATDVQ